ncbi:formyltransferase family protein [Flavobacteriales bacterium]|nr:formyltransferase family protein [Flavobacteriales bacterium]
MKIIFFGTPSFAATTLKFLIDNGHEISAIVSAPDSRKGRGKQLQETEVKKLAINEKITILQPLNLKDPDFVKKLKSFHVDLFVVVAFRMLPEIVWKIPGKGTINLHTSFLPNYRGAAPLNRVLINGESKTGVTTFFINEKIDAGQIIMQEQVALNENITAAQLHNILMKKGSVLLNNTINAIEKNKFKQIIQSHSTTMKNAPKITKDLLRIDWSKTAIDIHNLIRGLSPVLDNENLLKDVAICPSAWFLLQDDKGKNKRIKLQLTKLSPVTKTAHLSIDTDNSSYLKINVKDLSLNILRLQIEGKTSMNIKQFLQGNKINRNFKVL